MINWTDILDIVAVSIPLHLAFRALGTDTHRRVVVFLFALSVLYLGAREYNWALFSLLLQFAFAVTTIGIFLVFQEEIRRFLESVLHLGVVRSSLETPSAHSLETVLVNSVRRLSEAKVGALIVLEAKQPVRRLTKGGVKLDGVVSVPLLMSIFDHHSDGHDGAVVIAKGKVRRFGVHLPLCRKAEAQPGKSGTRHAAALGLSEVSDALVIVVSEESGAVSMAQSASISRVSIQELQNRLTQALTTRLSRPRKIRWGSVWRGLQRQTAALLASLILWMAFVSPGEAEIRHFDLPISLERLPTNHFAEVPKPEMIRATIEGTQQAFGAWLPEARTIKIDLSEASSGENKIALNADNLQLPLGLKFRYFEPTSILISLQRTRKVLIPVAPKLASRLPSSTTQSIKVEPAMVPIMVREGDPGPAVITTEPINYLKLLEKGMLSAKLVTPIDSQRSPETPESVQLTLEQRKN